MPSSPRGRFGKPIARKTGKESSYERESEQETRVLRRGGFPDPRLRGPTGNRRQLPHPRVGSVLQTRRSKGQDLCRHPSQRRTGTISDQINVQAKPRSGLCLHNLYQRHPRKVSSYEQERKPKFCGDSLMSRLRQTSIPRTFCGLPDLQLEKRYRPRRTLRLGRLRQCYIPK